MKLKKHIVLILISALIYSLSGCGNKNIKVSTNPENSKKIEVTINPLINKYTTAMSSSPGIPLTVKIKTNSSNENIKFHWVTEKGTFLYWQRDEGKIITLGKDIKINDQMIYWSVGSNEGINESSFRIYLRIEADDTSKALYETSIEVEQKKEYVFSIKK